MADDWRIWLAAENAGDHDQADEALLAAFGAVERRAPDAQFAGRVSEAVAAASLRQARITRAVLIAGGLIALAVTVVIVAEVPRLFGRLIDIGVGGMAWTVAAVDRGFSVWSVLGQFARATAALIVAPQVTLLLMALALIAIAALYGLNRVLELEERSSS